MAKSLPKVIFVGEEEEGDETYLLAHYNAQQACATGDRKRVGVYVLDHYVRLNGVVEIQHEKKKR